VGETDEAFADVDENLHRFTVIDIGGIELHGIGAPSEDQRSGFGLGGALPAGGRQDAKGQGDDRQPEKGFHGTNDNGDTARGQGAQVRLGGRDS